MKEYKGLRHYLPKPAQSLELISPEDYKLSHAVRAYTRSCLGLDCAVFIVTDNREKYLMNNRDLNELIKTM
jgi:hypothetical protein